MQIAVDRTAIVLPNQLRRVQLELEATDHVDVQRIEIGEQRLEAEPVPWRYATGQSLAATLIAVIAQLHAVVLMRYGDGGCVRRGASQRADEAMRFVGEIVAYAHERHDLPVVRQC